MANVSRPHLILAGLIGAAGVALAARGSHGGEGNIAIAANFMLLHAAALIGISMLSNKVSLWAGYALVAGLALFAGDLIMRAMLGTPLFPMAAPAGGFGLIAGWLLLAVSGVWKR
ncbi:MAG: DUF423 domain-containing protein [Hyphomicrobiales bacterium]|nr:MAG: DUF423 domain-containing protein [Hyphomicrobiales bacterium]